MHHSGDTVIPDEIYERLLEHVHDTAAHKVTLAVAAIGSSSPHGLVYEADLLHYVPLVQGLRRDGEVRPPVEALQRGIEIAVATQCILRVAADDTATGHGWLLLDTRSNRAQLEELILFVEAEELVANPPANDGFMQLQKPNLFGLYEQNIGLVTPIIADKLIEAMELYPTRWIEDAIRESVTYNRRNWRYIQRILENWASEGRSNETDRRHTRPAESFNPRQFRPD